MKSLGTYYISLLILLTFGTTLRSGPANIVVTKIADNSYQINGKHSIHLVLEDITNMKSVDAIVNPANKTLMKFPGGLAGKIWQAAGVESLNSWITKNIGKQDGRTLIPTGQARWTPSLGLAKHGVKGIIHAVGPNCNAGENISLIGKAYRISLCLANFKNYKAIAVPAISIGVFGANPSNAGVIAIDSIINSIVSTGLTDVYLVTWTDKASREFANAALQRLQEKTITA